MFTWVPTSKVWKLVCSHVKGMMHTWKVSLVGRHTVRLTPLTVAALVFEGELMASFLVVDGDAGGCLIYMPLHDVAVQPAVEYHAALHVDQVTRLELSQIGAVECLAHGCYGILAVLYLHHCEAHAVVCHALVYLQFLYKRAREGEVHVVLLCSDGLHTGHSFDDT